MLVRTDSSHRLEQNGMLSSMAAWCIRHAVWLVLAGLLLGSLPSFLVRGEVSEWHECYMLASRHLLAHEPMHGPPPDTYAYPPAMALFVAPLAYLSTYGSLFAWYVVNVVACLAWFVASWRLAGGKQLTGLDKHSACVLALAAFLALRWMFAPLQHQQFDLVIAALLVVGCLQVVGRKNLTAGLLLGVSAAMKCTPLLFLPYLVWRRPRAGLVMAVTAVGVNVLPDLLFPQTSGHSYLVDWFDFTYGAIAKTPPGTWHAELVMNQSLGGLVNRLTRLLLAGGQESWNSLIVPASVTFWLRVVTYGTALSMLAVSGWQILWTNRAAAGAPMGSDFERERVAREAASLCCLMLLLSPMSSKAHYVILFLPFLLVARQAIERPTAWRWLAVALLAIGGPLASHDIIGRANEDLSLVWGLPTWSVIVAWAFLALGMDPLRPSLPAQIPHPALPARAA